MESQLEQKVDDELGTEVDTDLFCLLLVSKE